MQRKHAQAHEAPNMQEPSPETSLSACMVQLCLPFPQGSEAILSHGNLNLEQDMAVPQGTLTQSRTWQCLRLRLGRGRGRGRGGGEEGEGKGEGEGEGKRKKSLSLCLQIRDAALQRPHILPCVLLPLSLECHKRPQFLVSSPLHLLTHQPILL